MTASPTVSTLPTTVAGLLRHTARQTEPQGRAPATTAPPPTGEVLNLRSTAGWGNVNSNFTDVLSTDAATFEAWIRTTVKAEQTIIIGADGAEPAPRIAVGSD